MSRAWQEERRTGHRSYSGRTSTGQTDYMLREMQSLRLASKEWQPRVPTSSVLFQSQQGWERGDSKMVLMSSKVSGECGRECGVGDSKSRRQEDSRMEI